MHLALPVALELELGLVAALWRRPRVVGLDPLTNLVAEGALGVA
jgi:hypothetical protein